MFFAFRVVFVRQRRVVAASVSVGLANVVEWCDAAGATWRPLRALVEGMAPRTLASAAAATGTPGAG